MRRGTSRVVPVVVSAGLAVGVFCGLLFGLGTGGDDAKAATTNETPKEEGSGSAVPDILAPKPPDPGNTTAGNSGSAAGSAESGSAAAGSAAGSAASGSAAATPAAKIAKLTFDIKPEAAAQAAKITIDGVDVAATSDYEMGADAKKKVVIIIRATGFKDYSSEAEIEVDKAQSFQIEMQKKPKPTGGGTTGPRPEGGGGKKKGGGLIDI